MPKNQLFESQILLPGTKFIVNGNTKDGYLGPGSTGFVSYLKGYCRDYQNVVFFRATVIRRGKGGKERLEFVDISTPIFDIENEKVEKMLPDSRQKHYVHMERDKITYNILDISNIDFLGWALSYSSYLYKLSMKNNKERKPWPEGDKHILNKALCAQDYYSEDSEYTKNKFGDIEWRASFVHAARLLEYSLVRAVLKYRSTLAGIEFSAIKNIVDKAGIAKKDIKPFIDTHKFLDAKTRTLHMLEKEYLNKKKSISVKQASSVV